MSRVDFDDAQHLVEELPGPAFAARDVREDEALPTGRDDDGREVGDPDVGGRPQVRDLGIPTVSDPCVYDPPAIVDRDVVGQYLRESVPVARCEVRQVALGHLACHVFEPPRLRAQLLEASEGGVDVILFVDFQPRLFRTDGEEKHTRPLQFVPMDIGALDDEFGDQPVGVERVRRRRPIPGVRHECPQFLDRATEVPRREPDVPMIGIRKSGDHPSRLVTVEFAERFHADLPDMRVGRGLAGQVPRFQLPISGVDVVEVERDMALSAVGVDLGEAKELGVERLGPLVPTRENGTSEDEALPADSENV